MADTKGNPGGLAHKLDARYRDDGDGTYSETEASNTWLWDATDLTWIKASVDHSTGALKVSISNTSISLSGTPTVSIAGTPTVTAAQSTPGSLQAVVYQTTDAIYNASTAITPSFATISTSVSGASTLISSVSTKKIRVTNLSLVANGAVNVKFQSHTAGDKTGLYYLAANGGIVLPHSATGWFETVAGEALDINLSSGVAVGGSVSYICV